MSDEHDNLHVVDTSKILTVDELTELKRLAAMSKGAKFIFAIILGAVSLIGIDRVVGAFLKAH